MRRSHAKVFFKYLEGADLEITAAFPAGTVGSTVENLDHAAEGEQLEWTSIYADFERIARDEGFSEIADSFKEIARVEKYHESRYRLFSSRVKDGTVFTRSDAVKWHCRKCGYVYEGTDAPQECPACRHPRSYDEVLEAV
jgi:rubrerythrin